MSREATKHHAGRSDHGAAGTPRGRAGCWLGGADVAHVAERSKATLSRALPTTI